VIRYDSPEELTAKDYANSPNPTDYEKIQLVKFFLMLSKEGDKNPVRTFKASITLFQGSKKGFDILLEEARNHFKDKVKLE
jgi:hypothetical protein